MAPKSLVGWNCSNCTFFHSVPSPRCSMCGELRNASRQQMRDFVQGKTIPEKVEGNVVEILTPEEKKARKESQEQLRLQQPKPIPSIGNPYKLNAKAQHTDQKKGQSPVNPFFVPRSNKTLKRNPYATKVNSNEDPWSNQHADTSTAVHESAATPHHALHPPRAVLQNSRPPLLPKENWISSSNGNTSNGAQRNNFSRLSKQACAYVPGPVPVDVEAAKTWIYPKNEDFPTRQYQLEIAETALFHNTLVSLPTGLGKTLIAAVVLYNYYRWFPTGKVIFMAPTLPLVSQQAEACYNIMGIPEKDTAILNGKIKPAARIALWRSRNVFYCTPQTVQKDLLSAEATSFSSQVCCIVLDEAHKASGDYAYTKVVEQLELASAKFRIVGLSATPGTTIKAIQQVIQALRTTKIEARYDTDPSVVPFIHQKHSEIVVVPKNDDQKEIERQLTKMLDPVLERLRNQGALRVGAGNATLTAFQIHKSREEYAKGGNSLNGPIIGYFQAAYKLVELRNDAHHSLGCVKTKILRLKQTAQRGILSTMVKSHDFEDLYQKVLEATGSAIPEEQSTVEHGNPKLKKLAELLNEHFCRARATEKSSRAIVFSQFRDSVSEVVELLKPLHPLIRARHFVGQQGSRASGSVGDESRLGGMKQSEQHQVIKWFREDVYNVLVCTCIGEEGLDIGEVDLIVNFDTLRSPIRMIQRTGRTGRKRDGRVVCLVSEGQEERTYMASKQAEKTLMRALRNASAFSMAPHQPLFQHKPTMQFSTIEISTKFRMSQVGQIQMRGSRRSRIDQNWRLSAAQEEERGQRLGKIFVMKIDWKDFRAVLLRGRRRSPQANPGGRDVQILRALERLGPTGVVRIPRRRGGGVLQSLFPSDPPSQQDEKSFFPRKSCASPAMESVKTYHHTCAAGVEVDFSLQPIVQDVAVEAPPPPKGSHKIVEAHIICNPIENSVSTNGRQEKHATNSMGDNRLASPPQIIQEHTTIELTTTAARNSEQHEDEDNAILEAAKEENCILPASVLEEERAGLDSSAMANKESSSSCSNNSQTVDNCVMHDNKSISESDHAGHLEMEKLNIDPSLPQISQTKSVFRLPTPLSSSEEEDNEEDGSCCDDSRQSSSKMREFHDAGQHASRTTEEHSVALHQDFCFRLPTQDSSSSSDDDDISNDEQSAPHTIQENDFFHIQSAVARSDQSMDNCDENARAQSKSHTRDEIQPIADPERDSGSESDVPLMSLKTEKPEVPLSALKEKSCRTKTPHIAESPIIGICASTFARDGQIAKKRRRIQVDDSTQSPSWSIQLLDSPREKPETHLQQRLSGRCRTVQSTPQETTEDGHKDSSTDTPGVGVDPDDISCAVCFSRESSEEDPIVLCDGGCNLGFHGSCYSIHVDLDSAKPWLCDECSSHPSSDELMCVFCSGQTPPLRKVKSGDGWCHPLCTFLSSKATSAKCMACSSKGAVKCLSCAKTMHPQCAITKSGFGLWTLALIGSKSQSPRDSAIFCPDHTVEADAFLSQRLEAHQEVLPSVNIIQTCQPQSPQGKAMRRTLKKVKLPVREDDAASPCVGKGKSLDLANAEDLMRKKKDKLDRLRRRRLMSSRFVVDEAEIQSDEDVEGDYGEANELHMLEEEAALSQDSFINDAAELTQHFSQDEIGIVDPNASHDISYHHRNVDARRIRENQFKTPVFNRRMRETESSQLLTTSSQKGLGNMHFIRSVLEHHRQGGNVDEIEAVYQELENEESEEAVEPPVAESPISGKIIMHCSSSDDESVECKVKANIGLSLTEEQRRMIELKRLAALERRKLRQSSA